ncbi:nitrate assimilation regulatory protein nira [Verticillium dahliae]
MYYHFAILLIFRPLIKLRIIGSMISPRDVCLQAADAIQGLLRSYSRLYTLRCTPSFISRFILMSAVIHVEIGAPVTTSPTDAEGLLNPSEQTKEAVDPRMAQAVVQGVEDLKKMSVSHQPAKEALHFLRYVAQQWKIGVDMADDKVSLAGCARSAWPFRISINIFAPCVREEDFVCIEAEC